MLCLQFLFYKLKSDNYSLLSKNLRNKLTNYNIQRESSISLAPIYLGRIGI